RVADAERRHLHPEDPDLRAAAAGVRALPAARRRRRRPAEGRARRRDGRPCTRAADRVAQVVRAEVHPTAVVYPGTVLGEGVRGRAYAAVGRRPVPAPRPTAKREDLPPAELGDGTVVSTGAIVFAGTRIGARVIVGDQACVRERVTLGDDVVLGRGSLIE